MAATPRRNRPGTHAGLFDDDPIAGSGGEVSSKPFAQFLRETPPTPLPAMAQYGLWAVGVVTLLLFLASVLRVAA